MNRKINVIQLVNTGMSDGGAETLVKDYALLLDKNKFNVKVVTVSDVDTHSANYQRLMENDVDIESLYNTKHKFYNIFVQKLWNLFIDSWYRSHRLLQIVKEFDADLIHAHLEVLNNIRPISSKLGKCRLVFTCHSEPKRKFIKEGRVDEKSDAIYLLRHNDLQMIALHDKMRLEINQMFNISNTIVVHNGIDFDKFGKNLESKDDIRNDLDIPKDSFLIGHVGRFSTPKNHLFLIDVFNDVLKINPNAHLLLVGSGDTKKSVLKKIESLEIANKCTILSHRTDIPRLLKAMDVFLFPSIVEGLPVSVVEAQAMGLRCVISDVVTPECFFGPSAIPVSLTKDSMEWAQIVLSNENTGPYSYNINDFNMTHVIEHLESIYTKMVTK